MSELFALLENNCGVEEEDEEVDDDEEEVDEDDDNEEPLFGEKAFIISTALTIARIIKNTISIGCPFFLATAFPFEPSALFCSAGTDLLFSLDAATVEATLHIKPIIAITAIRTPKINKIGAMSVLSLCVYTGGVTSKMSENIFISCK